MAVQSTHDRTDRVRPSAWAAVENYTALLRERTALRAVPFTPTRAAPSMVVERIMEMPDALAAVFVAGLSVSDSTAVQNAAAEAGGPLIVTELDALTATLAAAAVTTLRRRRLGPQRGRIAVLGAQAAPKLEQVLLLSGAGRVTNWFEADASTVPIQRVMNYNDVLIDLTRTASHTDAPGRTVWIPNDPFDFATLSLPGLLSALCGHGATELSVEALAASARALALITPTGRSLPNPNQHMLVPVVAHHITRILPERSSRGTRP